MYEISNPPKVSKFPYDLNGRPLTYGKMFRKCSNPNPTLFTFPNIVNTPKFYVHPKINQGMFFY